MNATWTKASDNNNNNNNNNKMNLTETILSWNETLMVKETVLYISSVTLQDYGVYNCIGINRYSQTSSQVSLMVLGKSAECK